MFVFITVTVGLKIISQMYEKRNHKMHACMLEIEVYVGF